MNVRRLLNIGLLVLSLAGIGVSAAHVIPYLREEAQSASLYAELAALHSDGEDGNETIGGMALPMQNNSDLTLGEIAAVDGGDDADAAPEDSVTNENFDDETTTDGDSSDSPARPVSHTGLAALHQKNPDCIAWITIEGTIIDYPVMYHPGKKDYYLHRDFNGNHASAGSLYIAEICDPYSSDNVIIYGHHMNSGKMFAALNRYKKKSFFEDHRRIYFETLNGTETYEVIYAFTTPVYTGHDFQYYAFANARTASEFDAYVSACRARALYDTGMTAEYGDRLLTLSTCEYSQKNGRMVVVAKKIT